MEITTKLVKHLADLSRLRFSETELEEFKKEFEKTLEHVDTLKKIDTSNINTSLHTLDAKTELREDVPHFSINQDLALKEAPEYERGMFKIKKIVE